MRSPHDLLFRKSAPQIISSLILVITLEVSLMKFRFIFLLIAVSVLCASALAQQTAEDWLDKGNVLINQSKYDDAIKAHDEAIRLDPNDVAARNNKGIALYD
jgi:tetratricopeptide (TPR) repeat protein